MKGSLVTHVPHVLETPPLSTRLHRDLPVLPASHPSLLHRHLSLKPPT